MIRGVGTDLLAVGRIQSSWERFGERFARRILSDFERQGLAKSRDPVAYLAKHFAAKEAVSKALGTGMAQGVSWHQIELHREPGGKPLIELKGAALKKLEALGGREVLISLSDELDYVLAFAVLAS